MKKNPPADQVLPFTQPPTYTTLPERCYSHVTPDHANNPGLIRTNHKLAKQLGIDCQWLDSAEGLAMLAGNTMPPHVNPIAMVYAGHQFGHWNPQLGDGRALLLGEIRNSQGQQVDIQLKGSGKTPYSRGGDGRSPLGPVLREYIVSEAMSAMGIPSTRALAAVRTGNQVIRETVLPGAILTRVASSHIRVGTFQFFAAKGDSEAVRLLADYVIHRHFPHLSTEEQPYLAMLEEIVSRQARLIAQWQGLGFIHGVMNTDNMLVCGETIDFGPCAFMDTFHPNMVYSSIDHGGRYAYSNQPSIAQWNLACLAEALLPLFHEREEEATALARPVLTGFVEQFTAAYNMIYSQKLGLAITNTISNQDISLRTELLELLAESKTDFTVFFRYLTDRVENLLYPSQTSVTVPPGYTPDKRLSSWMQHWEKRVKSISQQGKLAQSLAGMNTVNPVVVPRNHLVEEAIQEATQRDNYTPFHDLVDILAFPFSLPKQKHKYIMPPRPEEVIQKTFCGT